VRGFNPVNHPDAARYPVPVRFWQCEDDEVVSVEITRKFVDRVAANGGNASLRTFPEGGHEPQLAGEIVNAPSGNTRFGNSVLEIKPAVEEAFVWLKEQEARYLAER